MCVSPNWLNKSNTRDQCCFCRICFFTSSFIQQNCLPDNSLDQRLTTVKNKTHRLPTFKLVTENVIHVRSHANELVGGKEQLFCVTWDMAPSLLLKHLLRLKLAFHTSYTGAGRSQGVAVTSQTCYHGDKVLPAAVGSRPSLGAMVTGW